MTWQDTVNGSLEFIGSLFILLSIIKLYKDKKVRGISWIHAGFFTAWGYWNLYYYTHLLQWFSFMGTILIVTVNTFWLAQLCYYTKKEKNAKQA